MIPVLTLLLATIASAVPLPVVMPPLTSAVPTPLPPQTPLPPDTLRLEVGSPEVDGRVFPPHRARNRVYIGDATEPVRSWTNELTYGDSAGVRVARWVTRGGPVSGGGNSWELLQTFDARSLAPMALTRTASNGAELRLRFDGNRVHGVQRGPGETEFRPYERTLERRGFIASATDLVPMAVGLREGVVMTAPVWGPNMTAAEGRIFTVLREESVMVEGREVTAWRVEEHAQATGRLVATWWLTNSSPYMVLGEIPLADGRVQRITGVALDR